MARVKIKVERGNGLQQAVVVDTEATRGAKLGLDLRLPSGAVATPVTFLQWLGTTVTGSTSGSSSGPSLQSILTTKGDLATRDSQVQRLGIGSEDQALRVSAAGLPEWRSGEALTKTDDTNVTLTLGGAPSTSLLQAASLTLGWTGTLAATRGGTGFGSYTAGDLLYANSTTTLAKLGVGSVNDLLTVSGGAPAWAARSSLGGNPSASFGANMTGANGSAATFLRSDAVLKIDPGIAPVWTGQHLFAGEWPIAAGVTGMTLGKLSASGYAGFAWNVSAGASNSKIWQAYATLTTLTFSAVNDASNSERAFLQVVRSGLALVSQTYGNPTDNPTHQFYGGLSLATIATSTTVGPTGAAAALPALPAGYITVTIGGTACKMAYYNT